MTRRKSILKILFVALGVLLLAVFFAGCGKYTPPQNTGGNSPVTPAPDEPDNPDEPAEDDFTATLTYYDGAPFTSQDYSLITRLQAQWTEITDGSAKVYRANFNQNGVANAGKLDGDFNVTLVLTEDFKRSYTYDPNPYDRENDRPSGELKATNLKNSVTVPLYQLKRLGAQGSMNIGGEDTSYHRLTSTGAYSYTLQSREDSHMFFYVPQESGEYSFVTLMDVTADEVNPIVDLHKGQPGFYVNPNPELTQDGGGTSGNYTKNVWLTYQITKSELGGNGLIFNLRSESERADAYPLTIYFIVERDGEYTQPVEESVSIPVTEDFSNTPSAPDGTFAFIGDTDPVSGAVNQQHILNQSNVRYNSGDGYYYYLNPQTNDFFRDGDGTVSARYRIYAAITKPNRVLESAVSSPEDRAAAALNNAQLARGYYWLVGEDGSPKNYYDFIMGANGYAAHCNDDGVYPVTVELKRFLQDFAVSQRYFNDGNGFAEGTPPGYNSDEDSQWLFACGVYI